MAKTLKLQILTPEGTVYSDDVEMVTMPGIEGQMGVYPQHVPVMTQMVPGEIIVRKAAMISFCRRGLEVTGNSVAIATDMAIAAESIDEAKAEEARQRARLDSATKSDEEVASVNAPWPAH